MLKAKNLYYGISLKVEKGQIVAVLGPNGSGKSAFKTEMEYVNYFIIDIQSQVRRN